MLSKAEAHAFREQTRALAMQIGLRPSARALGLNEERVKKWAQRYHWNIGLIRPASNCRLDATLSPSVPSPIDAMANLLASEADRTRIAMARTSRRAFEHSDTLTDQQLHEMSRAIALEKHGKNASVAHQWTSQAVNVGVQLNVPLPSDDERREMRSMDAKLDAIAAKLRAG